MNENEIDSKLDNSGLNDLSSRIKYIPYTSKDKLLDDIKQIKIGLDKMIVTDVSITMSKFEPVYKVELTIESAIFESVYILLISFANLKQNF